MEGENISNEKLEWSALEYEEKERSTDWFWALGVIIITSSLASIIFNNYFFAVVLLMSGVLLGFFANRKPDMVNYELNEKGLKIRNTLYPYKNIHCFWVQKRDTQTNLEPMLFIKIEKLFMPMIAIPIEDYLTEEIHSIMLFYDIKEEEMKEHPSLKIMDSLGF
jgi:hypothetical protein